MTVNIAALGNAQAIGWADAPITRSAANRIGFSSSIALGASAIILTPASASTLDIGYSGSATPMLRASSSSTAFLGAIAAAVAGGSAAAPDVYWYRDAANIWAQRNGTSAQTCRIYGTYTDASNYRRVSLAMTTGGVATLLPDGAGTGSSGNVLHISGLPTSNPGAGILWNNAGTPAIGT